MVWLWLLFPLAVLVVTVALWRLTGRLDAERRVLQAEVEALPSVAEAARAVPDAVRPAPASGPEQVHR